jgi:hypothetical protein
VQEVHHFVYRYHRKGPAKSASGAERDAFVQRFDRAQRRQNWGLIRAFLAASFVYIFAALTEANVQVADDPIPYVGTTLLITVSR